MVLIVHHSVALADRPRSFSDLTQPRFDHQIQSGSPLESGTAFSSVAYLSRKYGWDYFQKLAKNHLASSGGNSTVIQKVESGEKKVGIVLLENALAAKKRGSPIEIIEPSDGGIPIPSVQVLLKNSGNPEAAEEFADFVLGREGQGFLTNGFMYSVRKDVAPPPGAPPFAKLTAGIDWTPELIRDVAAQAKETKRHFARLLLE
jgi:iron(III) transport system substrate-binding protein